MSYDELSLSGFIKEVKEASEGPHPRKFCFVLGAGASKTSGIMSGQELVDIWDSELTERNKESHEKWKTENGITEENKYGFYSQFYERRFMRQPSDGYNYLEKLMGSAKPGIGYVMLAYILTKSESKLNVVITTNFDHLTEDAVSYYTHTIPLVVGHESLAHYITKQINRPTIVKIHRDLLFDPKNTEKDVETLHAKWNKALDNIFSEYNPVFIGYAGNDKSLMNFLMKNSKKFAEGKWKTPYWLIYKTENLSDGVKSFLDNTNGYLVKHDGFDEVMYRLGAQLGYGVLNEEEFLTEPKERFKAIRDYINGFTDKLLKQKEELEQTEQATETNEDLEQAVQQVTDQDELLKMYRSALNLHNAKNYTEALKIEKELIKYDENNARYHNLCGSTLFLLKRFEEALKEKQRAVEIEPTDSMYHNNLGLAHYYLKSYKEAIPEFYKALHFDPKNTAAYYNLASALYATERYGEALENMRKAVELKPDFAKYRDGVGVVLEAMKFYDQALEEKTKALELAPDDAGIKNSLGRTLHYMKRYEEALEHKKTAMSLDPANAIYHNSAANTLRELKKFDEALAAEQQAIELDANNANYWCNLGIILREMKRFDEAIEKGKRAIELDNGYVRNYCSVSETYKEYGKFEEALEYARKAIEIDNKNAMGYDSAGVALLKLKRYDEALEHSLKAVELEPDDAEYQFHLGEIYNEMDKLEEALEAKKKAVELEPDNEEYKQSYGETLKKVNSSAA